MSTDTTYLAMIFVRRAAAYGIGHVGWSFALQGFALQEGIFNAGAVENHGGGLITQPTDMGFWMVHTPDPIGEMRARHYDEYKVIEVDSAHPPHAEGVAHWISRQAYEALGRNCMDDTYDILRTYGVIDLPLPATHWEPNYWFDAIKGRHFYIKGSGLLANATNRLTQTANRPPASHPAPTITIRPVWRDPAHETSQDFKQAVRDTRPMSASRKRYSAIPLINFLKRFF